MKKKTILLFVVFLMLLNGCGYVVTPSVQSEQPSVVPTDTPVPTSTPTPLPTETGFVPEPPKERFALTPDDVKNVPDSYKISLDDAGNLVGLPNGTPLEDIELVKLHYQAVQEKFFSIDVYYNKDEITGNWVLYSFKDKVLIHRTLKQENGSEMYSDYPTAFEKVEDGYKLLGEYRVEILPIESIGLMWNNSLPQLLMDKIVLGNGDSYYTKYLSYDSIVGEGSPWMDVPELVDVLATAPTPVPSDTDKDMVPFFTQNTSWVSLGVKINAQLIVDTSLSKCLVKVTVPNDVYAEFIARTIFRAWWKKGSVSHSSAATEEDFKNFMSLWSTAQQTGNPEDWEKVQLNDIWASDVTDGNGYVQRAYNIWPMYDGEVPFGTRGINTFAIVLVDATAMKNIDMQSDINGVSYEIGYGTNLDGETLMVYKGSNSYCANERYNIRDIIDGSMSVISSWLIENSGHGKSTSFQYNELSGWLYNRGLQVYRR